jgi:hypothetical protein
MTADSGPSSTPLNRLTTHMCQSVMATGGAPSRPMPAGLDSGLGADGEERAIAEHRPRSCRGAGGGAVVWNLAVRRISEEIRCLCIAPEPRPVRGSRTVPPRCLASPAELCS